MFKSNTNRKTLLPLSSQILGFLLFYTTTISHRPNKRFFLIIGATKIEMQSLCCKLRLAANQTLNALKSVESNNLGSVFRSNSPLLLNKKFATQIAPLACSRSEGIASLVPSYRCLSIGFNQSASLVLSSSTRNIATSASTSHDISATTELGPRIKFKRLDKTARHIMQILDKEAVEEVKTNREMPEIRPGYIIQLKVEVPENRRRVSIIKGIVIARRNAGLNSTFRLRRLVAGVGIESLFPLYSPNIKEIKVLDKKKVRRAKLYYLRDKMNALKKH